MITSNSNLLIEQKNLNLNLENDLKENAKKFQLIHEERNTVMLELNELKISYDVRVEELKNEVAFKL